MKTSEEKLVKAFHAGWNDSFRGWDRTPSLRLADVPIKTNQAYALGRKAGDIMAEAGVDIDSIYRLEDEQILELLKTVIGKKTK